jgi:hypothetical protein
MACSRRDHWGKANDAPPVHGQFIHAGPSSASRLASAVIHWIVRRFEMLERDRPVEGMPSLAVIDTDIDSPLDPPGKYRTRRNRYASPALRRGFAMIPDS